MAAEAPSSKYISDALGMLLIVFRARLLVQQYALNALAILIKKNT